MDKKSLGEGLYESVDYKAFKMLENNRDIREPHVTRFVTQLQEKGFNKNTPGLVNSNGEIIDGQHRFEACKRLGVPFCFRIDNEATIQDVIDIQMSRNWRLDDYVKFYHNKPDYAKLIAFIEVTGFQTALAGTLLANYDNSKKPKETLQQRIKNGTYTVDEESYKKAIHLHECIAQLQEMGVKVAGSARFIGGLRYVSNAPGFDFPTFIEQCRRQKADITKQTDCRNYAYMICDIYNHGLHRKIKFNFRPLEQATVG